MDREKAIELVNSILASHSDAVRRAGSDGTQALAVLANARSDIVGLVNVIYDTCEPTGEDNGDGDAIKMTPADEH